MINNACLHQSFILKIILFQFHTVKWINGCNAKNFLIALAKVFNALLSPYGTDVILTFINLLNYRSG